MRILNILKYFLLILAIGLLFYNWQIGLAVFLLATIIHVIPQGPNMLLNTILGYLIIGGVVYLFINWRAGILLFLCSIALMKFRIWVEKKNDEYYKDKGNLRE